MGDQAHRRDGGQQMDSKGECTKTSPGLELMVEGIRGLKEAKGSTLKRIGKYLETKYGEQLTKDRLRLYAMLRKAVTEGTETKILTVSEDGQLFKLAPKPRNKGTKAGRGRGSRKVSKKAGKGRKSSKPKTGKKSTGKTKTQKRRR